MDRQPSRREVLREFIKAYKRYSELWDTSHKDYNNRTKKAHCYAKLVDILRAIEPSATRDTVVKQINSLRSNFRKELIKARNASTCGDDKTKYTPSLWYYNDFLFLADRKTATTKRKIPLDVEELEVSKQEDESLCSTELNGFSPSCTYEYVDVSTENLTNPKRERKSTSLSGDHQKHHQSQQMLTPLNTPNTTAHQKLSSYLNTIRIEKDDDEFLLMAKNYAMKLKKMEPLQRLFADRIINEVLLEGQLGTLDRYSSVTNPNTNNSQSLIFEKVE